MAKNKIEFYRGDTVDIPLILTGVVLDLSTVKVLVKVP